MKLLFYSHAFVPSIGGIEAIVLSLARGLAQVAKTNGQQFEVVLATQTPSRGFDDASLPFSVVRQPTLLKLWSLIRAADAVHLAGPALLPLVLARLAGKPVAVEHHGFQTICPNGQFFMEPSAAPCPGHFMAGHHLECLRCNARHGWFFSARLWLLTFVRRFFCKGVAANIPPTAWLAGLLRLPRTTHIPHGIPSIAPVSQSGEKTGLPVIAFQGRLVTTKGVRVLLQAAQILREQGRAFELLIIGDGPERRSLEESARETQLTEHVRFVGHLAADQLELALSRASIVVVPSLGGEVFGLVAAENMRRGLPVVASDLGALAEVLGDAGCTFRTGDAAALATELARLLDDEALAARLGAEARQRASRLCDLDRMIESHASIYGAIVKR